MMMTLFFSTPGRVTRVSSGSLQWKSLDSMLDGAAARRDTLPSNSIPAPSTPIMLDANGQPIARKRGRPRKVQLVDGALVSAGETIMATSSVLAAASAVLDMPEEQLPPSLVVDNCTVTPTLVVSENNAASLVAQSKSSSGGQSKIITSHGLIKSKPIKNYETVVTDGAPPLALPIVKEELTVNQDSVKKLIEMEYSDEENPGKRRKILVEMDASSEDDADKNANASNNHNASSAINPNQAGNADTPEGVAVSEQLPMLHQKIADTQGDVDDEQNPCVIISE